MSVVTTFELDDLVAAGKSTCQAYRAHGRFGAGTDHAHQLNRGHQFAYLICHGRLNFCRCTEAKAIFNGVFDCLDDRGMGMAEDHRTPGGDIIDITVVVFIIEERAFTALKEYRFTTDATEGAYRRIYTPRDMFLGLYK